MLPHCSNRARASSSVEVTPPPRRNLLLEHLCPIFAARALSPDQPGDGGEVGGDELRGVVAGLVVISRDDHDAIAGERQHARFELRPRRDARQTQRCDAAHAAQGDEGVDRRRVYRALDQPELAPPVCGPLRWTP